VSQEKLSVAAAAALEDCYASASGRASSRRGRFQLLQASQALADDVAAPRFRNT